MRLAAVGQFITNSASGGRGTALQTLLVGVGVQHYKLLVGVGD